VVNIVATRAQQYDEAGIMQARPDMFKAFWPEVKGSYFFRSRRVFLDFMHLNGGVIYYIAGSSRSDPPFILVGNWRSRADITALWHVKGEAGLKKRLVTRAASGSFAAGSARFITRPLAEYEAEEFGRWGFETAYGIVLLEKNIRRETAPADKVEDMQIVRYRKKYMEEVLSLDATAFDDFWKMDELTMEAVANSCHRNVFLLARRGEQTLGYAVGGTNGRFGYLQRLGVDAGHQGQGIGCALASRIILALQDMGAASVMVNTQDENAAALKLYQKLGFEAMSDPRFIMHTTPLIMERGR
jgi:ribosomal protein S18 acetylase RimI-like enzyme